MKPAPEFITKERVFVALNAVNEAQSCAYGAREVLEADGEHAPAVLRALLLRICALTVAASEAMGDEGATLEYLRSKVAG